jgi:putative DNA primase/helicase
MTVADLFSDVSERRNGQGLGKLVKAYPYVDESGAVLFEVVRFEPKTFRQRRPDGR